jgi:hypothetical protein
MLVTSSIDSHIRTNPTATLLGAYNPPFEGRWTASCFGVSLLLFSRSLLINEMISAGTPGMLIAVVAKSMVFVISCY